MRATLAVLTVAVAMTVSVSAQAQQPTQAPVRRRQAPIEIRGQVPTPQVVTVRPREVPAYSRQVLVPNFYDHDFWPSILPGYRLVRKRQITGALPIDSVTLRTQRSMIDSTRIRTPGPDSVRQNVTPSTSTPPAAPSASQPPAGRSGTPPAIMRR
jgi:hypothetical protein